MMQELSVRDERDQEYEREIVAQACGAVEVEILNVMVAAMDEMRLMAQRIHCSGTGSGGVASVLGRNLARELVGQIYDSYSFRFDQYVSNEDAEDRLSNDEYAVDKVRQHTVELLRKLQAGK